MRGKFHRIDVLFTIRTSSLVRIDYLCVVIRWDVSFDSFLRFFFLSRKQSNWADLRDSLLLGIWSISLFLLTIVHVDSNISWCERFIAEIARERWLCAGSRLCRVGQLSLLNWILKFHRRSLHLHMQRRLLVFSGRLIKFWRWNFYLFLFGLFGEIILFFRHLSLPTHPWILWIQKSISSLPNIITLEIDHCLLWLSCWVFSVTEVRILEILSLIFTQVKRHFHGSSFWRRCGSEDSFAGCGIPMHFLIFADEFMESDFICGEYFFTDFARCEVQSGNWLWRSVMTVRSVVLQWNLSEMSWLVGFWGSGWTLLWRI